MTTEANFLEVRCWNLLAYPSERQLSPSAVCAFGSFHAHLTQSYSHLHRAIGEEIPQEGRACLIAHGGKGSGQTH